MEKYLELMSYGDGLHVVPAIRRSAPALLLKSMNSVDHIELILKGF